MATRLIDLIENPSKPTKYTLSISAAFNKKLESYLGFFNEQFGSDPTPEVMLCALANKSIDDDRNFEKWMKAQKTSSKKKKPAKDKTTPSTLPVVSA